MIKELVSDALLMPAVYERIGMDGAYMDQLKRRWLKEDPALKLPGYPLIGRLMQRLGDDEALQEQGRWLLQALPRLPYISANEGYVYATHELFLIKEFLFHYGKLQLWNQREGVFEVALPDLNPVFKKLDPQGSASPSFRLGPEFSDGLRKIIISRIELEQELKIAQEKHLQEACEALQIKLEGMEFVVSRSERELIQRLQHSEYFAFVSESVANLRFRLRDNQSILVTKTVLEKIKEHQQREEELVIGRLSHYINSQSQRLDHANNILQRAALSFMLADFGCQYDCIIPDLGGKDIRIREAVNLPLKWHLQRHDRRYMPVDLEFEARGNLITGPNMGGKSCALQTLGQLCRMSQLQIPLPCAAAKIPRFDNIWLNQDDSSQGADLSAFGREVVSFSQALQLPGKSLILLDEFARGTNPAEGEALLCAIMTYLKKSHHFAVAATHFTAPALMRELSQFAIFGPKFEEAGMPAKAVAGASERLKLLSHKMDYRIRRLEKGQKPPHSAIDIARLLGLSEDILKLIIKKDIP